MAQDPYSALAGGLQNGMNIAMVFQQHKAQQEQKKLDGALTGMKLYMSLLDDKMPKSLNKFGMDGLVKTMSDPAVAEAMGLKIPEGFDPSTMFNEGGSYGDLYKQTEAIYSRVAKGEIDKPTAFSLFGALANDTMNSRAAEAAALKDFREGLAKAYDNSPEALAAKTQAKITEKNMMVDAGLEETPEQRRAADTNAYLDRQGQMVNAGYAETPRQRRGADLSAALAKEGAMYAAGYKETPEQARQAGIETDRTKRQYMTPEAAAKRISEINVGRAKFGQTSTFTNAILAANPSLAGVFAEGERIPEEVKASVMKAFDDEESLLRKHIPSTPKNPGMASSHGTPKSPQGKKVVRTGTAPDGRRVAEYEDGTTGYIE